MTAASRYAPAHRFGSSRGGEGGMAAPAGVCELASFNIVVAGRLSEDRVLRFRGSKRAGKASVFVHTVTGARPCWPW